ncbi:MAG: PTS sugar transporter subunit IIB [Chloroflexi bacterium]|nr:PTS sugar transporter subunit IIB [Chloroflexota bacterium]
MRTIAELGLVRIDDRLIHGQVVAVWVKHLRTDRIVIVDDGVAKDPFMQEVLRLAAPPGITVDVCSIQEGIATLGEEAPQRDRTMVLLRSPQAARQLFDGGVRFTHLNVGGLGAGPGRKLVFKNISMSDEEKEILKSLVRDGVRITLQTVPGEQCVDFSSLVK